MKRKNIKNLIEGYFFVNPTVRLRVRQIERELNLPLPSVINYAKDFEKEEILTKLKIGNVVFYTSNRASKKFLLEKKFFNLRQVYSSGLIDFLIEDLSNPLIILFGSYAKGEDTEKSDIDLYIETPSKKEVSLEKFEKILKRKIQIFRQKNIHEIKNFHLANNILNGVILNGTLEVFK
jgi:predicted nucleotidyltransferase